MTTEKQIIANRKNGRKSTGPKTVKGKARSSKNALKHGLLAVAAILDDESRAEYAEFHDWLCEGHAPVGAVECMLVERIISDWWRLRRTLRIEREMMEADLETSPPLSEKCPSKAMTLGASVGRNMAMFDTYGKLSRYEVHLYRDLYAALRELRELQQAR